MSTRWGEGRAVGLAAALVAAAGCALPTACPIPAAGGSPPHDPPPVAAPADAGRARGGGDGSTCVECAARDDLVECPLDPRVVGVCASAGLGKLCVRFGLERCNGRDDDCDGRIDEDDVGPSVLCDDGIACTVDTCERYRDGALCVHDPDAPSAVAWCDDGVPCTLDACDPKGTLLVVDDPRDELVGSNDPSSGCRHVLRHSYCRDTWDGCACNGDDERCVEGPGLDGTGCILRPPWIDRSSAADCEQSWPCADRTGHPCDNCYEAPCCEASSSGCHREHLATSPALDALCASVAECPGGGPTCPDLAAVGATAVRCDQVHDGNPCTFEPLTCDPRVGCAPTRPAPPGPRALGERGPDGVTTACAGAVEGTRGCSVYACDGAGSCVVVPAGTSFQCTGRVGCCDQRCLPDGTCGLLCDTPGCMVH